MRTANFMANKTLRVGLLALATSAISSPAFAASAGDHHGFPWLSWAVSIVNLMIFLGILIKFAGPKIQSFFAERRRAFTYNLEEASRLRKEAEARLDEYTARLDALESERQQLLDEYHAQGEREKDRLIEAAKKQVEKMRADAELTIKQDVKKAVANLERQAVDLAVEMAHRMANEKLDAAGRNRLVDGYVAELGQNSAKSAQTTPA
ncbi:MAG: F0F1 ATP synthase subunit B [Bradymonadaceae bacterium]|nr:F0F1 ATP synthase subunit B [Lujinxingiaceae bacterium]